MLVCQTTTGCEDDTHIQKEIFFSFFLTFYHLEEKTKCNATKTKEHMEQMYTC